MVKSFGTPVSSMDYSIRENLDDLTSDFSVISHPVEEEQMENFTRGNLDHLQHLQFSGYGPEMLSTGSELNRQLSATSEAVHQHVQFLLKENIELKEVMQQNNATLRKHFLTLSSWQEQFNKSKSRHKQIYDDLQQSVDSLRKDKEAVEEILEEQRLLTNVAVQEKENETQKVTDLTKVLTETKTKSETLEKELERLNVIMPHMEQEIEELKNDLAIERKEKVEIESQLIKQQTTAAPLSILEEELGYAVVHHSGAPDSNLKNEIDRLNDAESNLREEKQLLATLLSDQGKEMANMKEELSKANKSNEELQQLLKEAQANVQDLKSIASPPKLSMFEEGLVSSSNCLEAAANSLQKCGDRFTSVDEQLIEVQKRLLSNMDQFESTNLQRDVDSLRALLKSEQDVKEEQRKDLDALHKEYGAVIKKWQDYQSEVQTQQRQEKMMADIENRKNQESLDEALAKIMNLEELLAMKEEENDKLKNRLESHQKEIEQIPILRAQVEIYQTQLKSEGNLRKQAEAKSNAQLADIQMLQAKNIQLLDEINLQSQSELDKISSGEWNRFSKHQKGATSSGSLEKQSRDKKSRRHKSGENFEATECPRCALKFVGLQAIQNHVEKCCFNNDDHH